MGRGYRCVLRVFGRRDRMADFLGELERLGGLLALHGAATLTHEPYWKTERLEVATLTVAGLPVGSPAYELLRLAIGDGWSQLGAPTSEERSEVLVPSLGGVFTEPFYEWASLEWFAEGAARLPVS